MPCHSLSGQDTQGKLHFTRSYRSNAIKNGFPIKLGFFIAKSLL